MIQLFPELGDYFQSHWPELAESMGFAKPAKGLPGAEMRGVTAEDNARLNEPTMQGQMREADPTQKMMMSLPQPVSDAVDAVGGIAGTARDLGASPEGAQLAMGPMIGRVAQAGEEMGPVFFSKLRQAIEQNPQKVWDAEQLKGFVTGKAGQDELKALEGLSGKLNKEQILKHLDDNGLALEERVLGGKAFDGWTDDDVVKHYTDTFGSPPDGMDQPSIRAAIESVEAGDTMATNATKFSKYQLNEGKGAENYKEILVKTPVTPTTKFEDFAAKYRARFPTSKAAESMIRDYWKAGHSIPGGAPGTPGSAKIDAQVFKSSHFPDDPNTLVHVRLNDRKTADGKRVKFLEEVQSDWHQNGRDKGYGPQYDYTVYYQPPNGIKTPIGYGPSEESARKSVDPSWQGTVSYTHLTLPTNREV